MDPNHLLLLPKEGKGEAQPRWPGAEAPPISSKLGGNSHTTTHAKNKKRRRKKRETQRRSRLVSGRAGWYQSPGLDAKGPRERERKERGGRKTRVLAQFDKSVLVFLKERERYAKGKAKPQHKVVLVRTERKQRGSHIPRPCSQDAPMPGSHETKRETDRQTLTL